MTDNRMIEWIWRQIAIRIPSDWECLQFSRETEAGRCAFADRHRYRLELNWRRFKAEPDFERMLKDYAGSLEASWKDIKPVTCQSWAGLVGRRDHESVSRFGRYLEEIGVLVEVVFIHLHRRDDSLENNILKTVRAVPPAADGFQQWRAFGMDMRVPSGFSLTECVVEPARVGLRFDGAKKPDRWIFRRYGMVNAWLKQPVREWLAEQVDANMREARAGSVTRGNIVIERLDGLWKPRGLLLPRGLYTASAWKDPMDGRLYHAICVTGKRRRASHPEAGADERLKSCPEFVSVPK